MATVSPVPYNPKDKWVRVVAGLLRYDYPVRTQWVSEPLAMEHFTTVSRAMKFYDDPGDDWEREKECILKFIG